MHVAADLNWFLQLIVLAFAAAFGLIYLFRNTASRYFVVDSSFDSSAADHSSLDCRKRENMAAESLNSCAVCGLLSTKQCARCKMVRYCSESCQTSHWKSDHKNKCLDMQSSFKSNHRRPALALTGKKASVFSVDGSSKCFKQSNKILFPYEEFAKYFSWDNPGYPPCGLLNCGNSCFANVVLQCLTYTRPLVAYLLEKGHRIECQREDWCFLCEFQKHLEKACRSLKPFSPVNILSKLPNIGGNLGCGEQEDAHELMRFAIDTMQSACLDEFGGEKYVHPSYQETTLIQHIFGGRLQSQVICAECNNVSNQFENMMDLTVEIHGDAESLEECLDQFTAKERLHGDNMYKCDGCNDYVMAWKRLIIQRPPNILTIALKRFQSGRFGKLNKRVNFPETLDLRPYITESEDGNDIYRLYAVIVHLDMMNASFFGHYICYIKDFCGNWYRMDDCEVVSVGLEEVLTQGVYMLLYSRIRARPSCLLPPELLKREEVDSSVDSGQSLSATNSPVSKVERELSEEELLSLIADAEDERGDAKMECCSNSGSPVSKDTQISGNISEATPSSSVNADEVNGSESDFSNISLLETEKNEAGPPNSASTPENIGQKNGLPSSDANGNRSFVKNSEEGNEELLSLITDAEDEGDDVKTECPNLTLHEDIQIAGSTSTSSPSSPVNADVVNESENGFLNGSTLKTENQSFEMNSGSLKPLFARGFLEKTPRKKFVRPDDGGIVPVQENEKVSR